MIEKLSPSLELALQNELRQAYLKGVETGRKRVLEEMEHEQRKFIDGFAHSKKCEECSKIKDASDGSLSQNSA